MTKEAFINLIERMKATSELVNEAYRLKVDLVEFLDPWEQIITILLKELFTKEGYEWISWWVYEDGRKAYEEVGDEVIEVPMDTAEDLYNYLLQEGYIHE
jgi:hypothetical protein